MNIVWADQDQILECNIQLRLAVQKGSVHILPIEDFIKSVTIAQTIQQYTYDDNKS